jgi:hypothetical protein
MLKSLLPNREKKNGKKDTKLVQLIAHLHSSSQEGHHHPYGTETV